MDRLTLTDDEILAVASIVKTRWPAATPTVAVTRQTEAGAATRRGIRSLFVRELVEMPRGADLKLPRLASQVAELLAPAIQRRSFFASYLGDRDLRVMGLGSSLFTYVADEQALMETVTPIGVHYFAATDQQNCASVAREIVTGAFSEGCAAPPDASARVTEDLTLCAIGPGAAVTRALSVQRSQILEKTLHVATGTVQTLREVNDPGEACKLLLQPAAV